MSKNYSTQGSVVIKRLRTGGTLFTSFKNLGGPLYQGVDPDKTPALVAPDWETETDMRPVIQPVCRASDGLPVTLMNHRWLYNDVYLEFNSEADSDGYKLNTNADYYTGYFAMKSDGTLKIVKNLASKENDADDGLTYEGIAAHNGVNNINVTCSTTVDIQHIASNSFTCTVYTANASLDKETTSTVVKTALYLGGLSYTDKAYTVEWYRNSVDAANKLSSTTGKYTISADSKSITINRDGVDGSLELVAVFLIDGERKAVGGITIKDVADEFVIRYKLTGEGVDESHSVAVEAYISKIDGDIDITSQCSNITWDLDVVDYETKSVVRHLSGNTTNITNADSIAGGGMHDVVVTGGVEFTY